jgi:uncharacterized secreted protein with C-terminal beta-propeller domain
VAVLAATGACTRSNQKEAAPPGDTPPQTIETELISALVPFDACDDLLAYLRTEGAKLAGPYGFNGGGGGVIALEDKSVPSTAARQAGPAAATTGASAEAGAAADDASSAPPVAGADFSATNVQEEGVDEPDLVKTDGRRLVTIAAGELRVVDVSGDQPRLAGSLRLDEASYLQGDLLLSGDRVLVIRPAVPQLAINEPVPDAAVRGDAPSRGIAADQAFRQPQGPSRTSVSVVDIADPAAPKLVSDLTVDGDLVAARMVGGVARLVLRSGPPNLPFLYPSGSEASVKIATEANQKVVAESTLEDWLPGFEQDSGSKRRLAPCDDVSRPEVFSGVGMLSVFTVDALDPRPGPAATVVGAGELVYASTKALYVTSTKWEPTATDVTTDVHKFDIADKVRTSYVASGSVSGRLLNSFSMSEYQGDLRVASPDDSEAASAVTVLRQKDKVLEPIGGVGGLGKSERIYAVRFLGDRGYVVTFRQTDPLYVLDLADPTAPVVKGELKIPGYSAYLHPIGEHRLLGVGQDATEQGRVQGTQVSLFDVSDPTAPKRLASAGLPRSQSEAEFDHHAFLWWAKTGLTMVPVQSYEDGTSGAVGFKVTDDAVTELGRVQQRDRQPIRRSIVVRDRVLTLSESGLLGSDLASLAERSWLPFG